MVDFDTKDYLTKLDKYWRASNYLSACQLYLLDNPLLKRSLVKDDIKKKTGLSKKKVEEFFAFIKVIFT